MPTEDEYRQWKLETFGSDYMIWHDGLHILAVSSLTGDARENALVMLHKGVKLGDSHAADALAGMGEVGAVADLRAQLAQSKGEDRVRVASAIHALSPDESLANELIEVLKNQSLHWGNRMRAAIGLRQFGDSESESALLDAIEHDGDFLVRNHASESLLARWGVNPSSIAMHQEIFKLISSPQSGVLTVEEQARLAEATTLLKKLHKQEE
jgi:HEAT repeat protein